MVTVMVISPNGDFSIERDYFASYLLARLDAFHNAPSHVSDDYRWPTTEWCIEHGTCADTLVTHYESLASCGNAIRMMEC